MFKMLGTKLCFKTTYHPQSDGQSEVVNRCLKQYLQCFVLDKPKKWWKWLGQAEYWYNTTFHGAIECLSFKALYGRDPPALLKHKEGSVVIQSIEEMLMERDGMLDKLRMRLIRA